MGALDGAMTPAEYDAWYDTPRGRWIGEIELGLLLSQLIPHPGDRVLDVGCGTGWFTRRLSNLPGIDVTGIDVDGESLEFARQRDPASSYVQADACRLPFDDYSFDGVVSVAALCFVADWPRAMKEIVRVCRKRFVIALLNRRSLLWRQKGRDGGVGAYRGAHWHTMKEVRNVLSELPADSISAHSAIYLPSGSWVARSVERCIPTALPVGGLLVFAGGRTPSPPRQRRGNACNVRYAKTQVPR
jgi:SAM-dependent methyltransferase